MRRELFGAYRKQTEDRTNEQRLGEELGTSLREEVMGPSASRNKLSFTWQILGSESSKYQGVRL